MSLADEMRTITNVAQNTNDVVTLFWEKGIAKIKEQAAEGKHEICFYDICHPCNKGYSSEVRKMLIDKFTRNGFMYKKGIEIGKGMGSWETPYILW